MFLEKRTYIGNPHKEPGNQVTISDANIKPERVTVITEEIAYWRKANAIHKWFVDNVQDGTDDCATYFVSAEQLRSLLKQVNIVLAASELVDGKIVNGHRMVNGKMEPQVQEGKYIKDPAAAKKLLPTSDGFFFGSTDYDQWYYEHLQATAKVLATALAEGVDYYYRSSW